MWLLLGYEWAVNKEDNIFAENEGGGCSREGNR